MGNGVDKNQMDGTNSAGSPALGPLIHLRALNAKHLPSHPALASAQTGSATSTVNAFAANALDEAEKFMTTYLPANFNTKSTSKDSSPSAAKVELSTKDIDSTELPPEARAEARASESWFARKSVHQNAALEGTATWEEFDHGLRIDHSQHEMEYTPGVIDAHEIMNWNEHLLPEHQNDMAGWEEVHVNAMEMLHKIPALNNRVFPVLVVTAKKANVFMVVQIPVSTENLPGVKYHKQGKITEGMYCSVERCELVDEGKNVMWQMATASDAKGVLPMWVQKMGVPGAVVKDVGLFMGWVSERRKK